MRAIYAQRISDKELIYLPSFDKLDSAVYLQAWTVNPKNIMDICRMALHAYCCEVPLYRIQGFIYIFEITTKLMSNMLREEFDIIVQEFVEPKPGYLLIFVYYGKRYVGKGDSIPSAFKQIYTKLKRETEQDLFLDNF